HTRSKRDWSSDVCSSDLELIQRDIDDERVRTEIVSYLKPQPGTDHPRFFPPIVLAVLARHPAVTGRLADRYPAAVLGPNRLFPRSEERRVGKECVCSWAG